MRKGNIEEVVKMAKRFNILFLTDFGFYYRQNRHGNKKAKVIVFAKEGEDELKWKVICRLSKRNEISWEFPDDCPEFFCKQVKNMYSDEEVIEEFQKLERRKKL